VHISFACIILQ